MKVEVATQHLCHAWTLLYPWLQMTPVKHARAASSVDHGLHGGRTWALNTCIAPGTSTAPGTLAGAQHFL